MPIYLSREAILRSILSMRKRYLTLLVALAPVTSQFGCKATDHGASDISDVVDEEEGSQKCLNPVDSIAVPGLGYVGTTQAIVSSTSRLETKQISGTTKEICPSLGTRVTMPFRGYGELRMEISGETYHFAGNSRVNYGYIGKMPCPAALGFFSIDANAVKIPPSEFAAAMCEVQLDTEDRYWFGITVHAPWMVANNNFDVATNKQLESFLATILQASPTKIQPLTSPLLPGKQLNVGIDPALKDAMVTLYQKFQVNDEANKELRTCLRNARAHSWMEIQAHFYCILPYDYRACYSNILVDGVKGINTLPPQEAVKELVTVMHDGFDSCFAPGANFDLAKDFPNDGATIVAAFKYANFVKQGVMDFNLSQENELINDFYRQIDVTRPPRLLDPKDWTAQQVRFTEVRKLQANRIKGALCANSGGTATATGCTCPQGKVANQLTTACQ